MVVLSKDAISSSKSRYSINCSLLYLSDVSLSESELKYKFSVTCYGFPCRVYFSPHFYFLVNWYFFCKSYSSLYFLSEKLSNASSSPSWVTLIFYFTTITLVLLGIMGSLTTQVFFLSCGVIRKLFDILYYLML